MSDLGGVPILELRLDVPPSGASFGTMTLDASALPDLGTTTLTIGDLPMGVAVVRRDFDDHPGGGRVVVVVYGGAGGWRLPVTRAGAYGGGEVRLSTVLADLGSMTGETIAQPAEDILGQVLTWPASTPIAPVRGQDVLADLVWRGYLPTWRLDVGVGGSTVFEAWPVAGPADGFGRITGRSGSRGRRTVGLDTRAAAFLPGGTLEGISIARVTFHESAQQGLRAEVYDR